MQVPNGTEPGVMSSKYSVGSQYPLQAKEKYRGMFKTQKSGNKTGEIGLDNRTHARLSINFMTLIPDLTFTELRVVFMEHLQR